MKILNVWFGNREEAFYEGRLSDGFNMIYSQGLNNRGKTVMIQSIFFALGSKPKFPYGFDSEKENYYVVEIEENGKKFIICRKKDTFIVRSSEGNVHIFSSEADYKRYYHDSIYKLPKIIKDGRESLVYLSLFNQLFFLGQDGKDTSTLYNLTYFNKVDFMNMLYSLKGYFNTSSSIEVDIIKSKIKSINETKKNLISKNEILNNKNLAASLVSYTANRIEIDTKLKKLEKIKISLSFLKKERNRLLGRKTKNELLIEELKGLNRTISEGSVYCINCGSTHIGYHSSKEDISFDVSDLDTQKLILVNIQKRIDVLQEDIQKVDIEINEAQENLNELLKDEEVTIENLIFSQKDILEAKPIDEEIKQLDIQLSDLISMLEINKSNEESDKQSKNQLIKDLVCLLNKKFHEINFDGNPKDVELFTSRGEVVSGSESAAFYLARFYALQEKIGHNHPIIIDDFREKELSSTKENMALELYKNLPNQVIFSCTLKDEEIGKYNKFNFINQIDYTEYPDSHILNTNDVSKLSSVLEMLSIKLV